MHIAASHSRLPVPFRAARAVAVAAGLVAGLVWLGQNGSVSSLMLGVSALGGPGVLLFAAVLGAATALMVPRGLLFAAAGAVYGPLGGVLVGVAGELAGALVVFGLARLVGRERLSTAPISVAAAEGGAGLVMLSRLSPWLPVSVQAGLWGLTRLSPRAFVLGMAGGAMPELASWAVAGASMGVSDWGAVSATDRVWVGILATVSALGVLSIQTAFSSRGS